MQDDLFIELVEDRAGVDRARADALAKATLRTLAEQVSTSELVKMTAELPKSLKAAATPPEPHRTYETSLGDFSQRVGELAGIDESDKLPGYVRDVFTVLAEAVGGGELRPVMDQLPEDFQKLVPAQPDRADPDAFLATVQQYGQMADREQAQTATGVTLNLLADRISPGQADKISPALPQDLRTYLATNKKTPQSFDKDTFLDRVVTATGVADKATAERRVRAVLTTLREWISETELRATTSELPPEIAELFD